MCVRRTRTGLTLVELMIASMILVIIMLALYSGFQTGLFSARGITGSLTLNQSAVQALDRINTDVRNSFGYSGKKAKFTGDRQHMSFLSLVDGYDSVGKVQEQYASVAYALEGDKLIRSTRMLKDALDDAADFQRDDILQGVEGLTFAYGSMSPNGHALQWGDVWVDAGKLPLRVRIVLVMKDKERQEDFMRNIVQPVAVYE